MPLITKLIPLGLFLIPVFSMSCSGEDSPPNSCRYDHECRGENERCFFEEKKCYIQPGSCEGTCKKVEEKPKENCQCKTDSDCNYPFEGCAACKCYKRDVLPCKTDADCGRGRVCIGPRGKRICYIKKSCNRDEDCLPGFVCREKSCCDAKRGRCPGQCKIGSPCEKDYDCLACNMICRNKRCAVKTGNNCLTIRCKTDRDCSSCGGKCLAGRCRTNQCTGISCTTNSDCQFCGGECLNGYCRKI